MQTNVAVTGSLVFNAANVNSGTYTTTTYPATTVTGATNNGYAGILQTYNGTTEYLLDVQGLNVDAIQGYPPLHVTGPTTVSTTGNNTTGYVSTLGTPTANGGLQRAIGSVGSYVFPIGTTSLATGHGYNAVQLNFTTIPAGGGTVKGKFVDYKNSAGNISNSGYIGTIDDLCPTCGGQYQLPPNEGWNYYFSQNPCNSNNPQWFVLRGQVIKHGFWTFGSATTGTGTFTYSIETFPNNITGPQNLSQEIWRVLKYDDPSGDHYGFDPSTADWTSQITSQVSTTSPLYTDLLTYSLNTEAPGHCYTGNGIPGGLYTGFSEFALDKSNSDVALPVTLVSLEAYPVNNSYIQVQWITSLEINNSGFKVERSTDAINFTDIGWVAGHDNSTQENTYNYNDYNVAPDIVYYYRLILVDNNGNQTPTDIVQAQLTGGNMFAIGPLFPNPASNQSSLNITTSEAKNIDVKLYDIIGQQISDKQYDLLPGVNTISFNTQQLAGGPYTIILTADNDLYSRKLVIAR